MSDSRKRVLLVDDDPQILEVYAQMLEWDYDLVTAADGETALATIDDSFDVVLLDRRMPEMTGGEVLDAIRDRGYDCPVIMVTAVEPDIDIITMPFNDYLTKPVTASDLRETIERVASLSRRDIQVQEYFAQVAKREALVEDRLADDYENDSEFRALCDRIDDLEERIDPPLEEFEERLATRLAESREIEGDDTHWMQQLFG